MMARPQSTPPLPEHMNTWATSSLPSSHGTPSQQRHNHRHSAHGYASLLSRPIYHPLQHQRGSDGGSAKVGEPGSRRVSSPDIKVNSLRRYPASRREEDLDARDADSAGVQSLQRRNVVQQRGRVRGSSSGRGESNVQHWRSQSDKPREAGGLKLQRCQTDTCLSYHQQGSTGSQAGQTSGALSGPASNTISGSQTSWERGGSQHNPDPVFRQPSGPTHLSHSKENAVGSRVLLHNRGDAWQLEEEEEEVGGWLRGGRPSGRVDEALFTSRIPRHYFHSAHSHTGTHSQSHTGTHSQSTHSQSSVSTYQQQPSSSESQTPPYQHWLSSAGVEGSQETPSSNSGGTNCGGGTRSNKHQRVTEWLQGTAAAASAGEVSDRHTSHSLPRSLRRSHTMESRKQHATRTFSYIQAQVHPVHTQDTPPHKGFDPQQMAAEHQRSSSATSEGEILSASSTHSRDSASQSHLPHSKSSPHPFRARTKSTPNPDPEREPAKRGKSRDSSGGRKVAKDSVHPDKRFSTGNIDKGEENLSYSKLNIRRSASPVVSGHVTNHAPCNELEEEATSSDDTGGQSDVEGTRRIKPRSKSSGSLMSKIARRLGRMNVKPDQYPYDEAPPPCGDDGTDDNVSSTMRREGGHALQVPIPQTQQKRMQSVSSPQLERSSDGCHSAHGSLPGRLSPDYLERDNHSYRSHGTPPPGPGTPYGTPKMSRASPRTRQRSLEPDQESSGGFTAVFRSGSKRNLSADINTTLLDYVEQGNFEGVEQLLESSAAPELNVANEDDFTFVDLAAMLGHDDIAKLLLSRGARDSTRFCRDPFSRFRHIMTLLNDTERELDSLRYELVVHNSSSGSSSAVRDMERRLKRLEWKVQLFTQMKANYESADLPGVPTDVTLHVTSNRSLTVKFSEPLRCNGAPVTRYKIEWCLGSDRFSPIVGEFVLTDLRANEYVIPDLNKGERYFVRVSTFNMKGFGQPQLTTPPMATPSSWHDEESSRPRFEGSTDNIHIISAQLNMSLTNSPPMSPPPTGGTPSVYRKTNVKKSISKLFGSNIRFQKSLRPGVYISSLVHSDDSRVVVTVDDQLPTIVISDSPATGSIGADFVWLAKVACTWDQVKGMVEVSDNFTSSPAIQSRNRMLHAILELQTVLGLQDLGLLHPVPYRDRHGAVVFVIVQYVKDTRSVQSSSLRWASLPRLWRKRPQASDLQAVPVPDQLILDAQEIIAHHGNSTRPLSRGLYLGYLKARSTVASMKVICSREYPNVLPHHKIRDNPNISQEEWKWLKSLTSPTPSSPLSAPPSSTPSHPPTSPTVTGSHSLQSLLPTTINTFLHNLGICKEGVEKHQLYSHEVIELNEDISLLLILPPSDQVCTPPGSTDHFLKLSDFVALPINTFEIMQLYTYQKAFMTKFSTVSARLDIELLTSQQRMREAFSKAEVSAAKQLREELESFQEKTDLAWKEMRWIEEALQKGRNPSTPVTSLLPVRMFMDAVRAHLPSSVRRGPIAEPSSGYLRVFPAYKTGLISGTSVKLFITEFTTTREVIRLVVQQLEKARIDKGVPGTRLTQGDVDDFFLVARQNGKETALDYDYTPLQLQMHPNHKWHLLVRRVSDDRRTSEHTTSV